MIAAAVAGVHAMDIETKKRTLTPSPAVVVEKVGKSLLPLGPLATVSTVCASASRGANPFPANPSRTANLWCGTRCTPVYPLDLYRNYLGYCQLVGHRNPPPYHVWAILSGNASVSMVPR